MGVKIGFLGFGEAASNFAAGFAKEGGVELYAFDVMLSAESPKKDLLMSRLAATGCTPVASIEELAGKVNTFFMLIPPKFAESLAMQALPFMTNEHLFCDLTSNKPAVKAKIGAAFEEKGALYTDASVMGAVPIYQHKTPTIVCGNGADEMISRMVPCGMDLKKVGGAGESGKAVRIKLTRSIFVKGAEALVMETLMTARKLGIEDEIVSGIEASFNKLGFVGFCGQLCRSGVLQDERRSVEAGECKDLIDELGLNSIMMEAAQRKLKWSADLGYTELNPIPDVKTLDDLYALWEKTNAI